MPAELLVEKEIDVRDAILNVLEEAGVDKVFGMPGGHTGRIYASLASHAEAIRTVMVRQESLAAVMAEVTGRITGVPGVIMGQGPWVLGHGVIGTLEAMLASSPMVLLTELCDTPGMDQHAPFQAGTGDYGVWDAKKSFEGITKQVFVARNPVAAVQATQLAFKHAMSGQPGPVAVLYSRLALHGTVAPDSKPLLYKTRYYLPPAPPPARTDLVEQAAAAIRAAERPVLIAGNGARVGGANEQVRRFAEDLGIPVVSTATGKSVIPETHPMALGPFGSWGVASANMTVADADLLIVAGSKLGASDTNRENPLLVDPRRQTIIQIDVEPRNASWVFPAEHVLIGSVGVVLDQLREAVGQDADRARAGLARVAAIREERGYFNAPTMHSAESPMLPQRVFRELSELLPENAILTGDAGSNRMLLNHYFQVRMEGGCLEPGGAAAMGYAIPAALGAKLACPDRTAVAICGDGGFAMGMNGLISAIEEGIKIIVVVLNNVTLGAVYHDTGPHGAVFKEFDYAAMARGMGCHGIRVNEPDELADAIRDAVESDQPTVIDVMVSPKVSFWEAISEPLGNLA